METNSIEHTNYQDLVSSISNTFEQGRQSAARAINTNLLQTYWQIGQYIVEFEQKGNDRATYGKSLIDTLSKDLSLLHGKGFNRSNLIYMRLLYFKYPISEKPSHLLNWSHYVELLKIDNDLERSFYEKQTILENWSIPELKRMYNN